MQIPEIAEYAEHEGTVRVSGKSEVGKVGKYIVHLVISKISTIDILFIGANAGQQAYKACSIAGQFLEKEKVYLGFYPLRFRTWTEKRDQLGAPIIVDGKPVKELKDAFVWRIFDATAIRAVKANS